MDRPISMTLKNWRSQLPFVLQSALVATALLIGGGSVAGQDSDWSGCLSDSFEQGATERKIAACTLIVARNPDDMGALLTRGYLFLHQGKADLAKADFEKVVGLEAKTEDWRTTQELARCALQAIAFIPRLGPPKFRDPDPDPKLNESIVRLPIDGRLSTGRPIKGELVLSMFRPDGPGPFPTVIMNHGVNGLLHAFEGRFRILAPDFVKMGFAVLEPTRIGFGVATVPEVPEVPDGQQGCEKQSFRSAAEAGPLHILRTVEYAKGLPWVDMNNIVLAGVSAGGMYALLAGGMPEARAKAVINFAGGMASHHAKNGEACGIADISRWFSVAGSKNPIPTIWFYSENDTTGTPALHRVWYTNYVRVGGRAEFEMLPPLGDDGHQNLLTLGQVYWMPLLTAFFDANGIPHR